VANPTPFPDLNGVLAEMVAGAQTILAANFCGAYLQGSFATGDADVYSDVDFVVVTDDELTEEQQAALQELHGRLYELDVPWAQHLEGSYIPRDRLRRVDDSRASYFYLDNGARELIWDSHCNTAVVRWTLREQGVVLAGPDPKSLIDPVSAEHLRDEALAAAREYAEWAPGPTKAGGMSRWKQPYLVLTFCRILHTLSHATVVSKREAGEWARDALDPEWAGLIQRALDDRPDPWARVYQPVDPEVVDRTLAFVEYALAESEAR